MLFHNFEKYNSQYVLYAGKHVIDVIQGTPFLVWFIFNLSMEK